MKKINKRNKIFVSVALVFILLAASAFAFAGCAAADDNKILIVAPNGAPAFAMAELFAEKPQFDGLEVEYRVISSADPAEEISQLMTSGEADIAILPSNKGAILYNKGEDVKFVGATTFGMLYLVSTDPAVNSIGELAGKSVTAFGQGDVPDFVLGYLLKRNGVEAEIAYAGSPLQVREGLAGGTVSIGLLAEPVATATVGLLKQSQISVMPPIDLQAEWEKVTGNDGYPQSALFARGSVAKNHPEVFEAVTSRLANSPKWIKENLDLANAAVTAAGGSTKLPKPVADANKISVGFVAAKDIKEEMNEYFGIMGGISPRFIGWKFPDDEFYL